MSFTLFDRPTVLFVVYILLFALLLFFPRSKIRANSHPFHWPFISLLFAPLYAILTSIASHFIAPDVQCEFSSGGFWRSLTHSRFISECLGFAISHFATSSVADLWMDSEGCAACTSLFETTLYVLHLLPLEMIGVATGWWSYGVVFSDSVSEGGTVVNSGIFGGIPLVRLGALVLFRFIFSLGMRLVGLMQLKTDKLGISLVQNGFFACAGAAIVSVLMSSTFFLYFNILKRLSGVTEFWPTAVALVIFFAIALYNVGSGVVEARRYLDWKPRLVHFPEVIGFIFHVSELFYFFGKAFLMDLKDSRPFSFWLCVAIADFSFLVFFVPTLGSLGSGWKILDKMYRSNRASNRVRFSVGDIVTLNKETMNTTPMLPKTMKIPPETRCVRIEAVGRDGVVKVTFLDDGISDSESGSLARRVTARHLRKIRPEESALIEIRDAVLEREKKEK